MQIDILFLSIITLASLIIFLNNKLIDVQHNLKDLLLHQVLKANSFHNEITVQSIRYS